MGIALLEGGWGVQTLVCNVLFRGVQSACWDDLCAFELNVTRRERKGTFSQTSELHIFDAYNQCWKNAELQTLYSRFCCHGAIKKEK